MKLIIEDDEGKKNVIPLVQDEMEMTIGRQEGNAIRLSERNVSRKHARLIRKKGTVLLEDLGSYCGVRVNGQRISTMVRVSDGDVIQIGDYDIILEKEPGDDVGKSPSASAVAGALKGKKSGSDPADFDDAGTTPPPIGPDGLPLSEASFQRMSTSIINMEDPSVFDQIPALDIPLNKAPRLIVQSGDAKTREFALIRTAMTLGRDYGNDIAIDHRSLSSSHCKFVRLPNGEWKIIDLKSTNGVSVNGEKYEVSSLVSGDTILVGKVKMRFQLPGDKRFALVAGGVPPWAYVSIGAGVVILLGIIGFLIFGRTQSTERVVVAAVPPVAQMPSDSSQVPSAPQQMAAPDVASDALAQGGTNATDDDDTSASDETAGVESAVAAPSGTEKTPEEEAGERLLERGKTLMSESKFSEAKEVFAKASAQNVSGAVELLKEAAAEAESEANLSAAKEAFEGGKLDEAQAHLEGVGEDSFFAKEAEALAQEIVAAKAKANAQLAKEKAAKQSEQSEGAAVATVEKKAKKRSGGKKSAYGANYVEIPEDKAAELERYLGEECDHPNKAIPFLRKLIKQNSDYGYAYLYLGSCYVASGNNDMGARQYKYFLDRWPKHPDAAIVREQLE